jgi:hypothetical protein
MKPCLISEESNILLISVVTQITFVSLTKLSLLEKILRAEVLNH